MVALFIAVLMLPSIALAVDVGGMYSEKRRLQNSADSGAMAVALTCAADDCDTASSVAEAETYGESNNSLGVDVSYVCGEFDGLNSCDPDPFCPADPPSEDYVQVGVSSQGEGWDPFILPSTKNVEACARATLTGIGSYTGGLAATMSTDCWNAATSNGTVFGPSDPADFRRWPNPNPTTEVILTVGGSAGSPGSCKLGNGQIIPGGFGWLAADSNTCTATTDLENNADSGDGVSGGGTQAALCKAELLRLMGDCVVVSGSTVNCPSPAKLTYVPIFDVPGSHSYHLAGYSAFVVTGFHTVGGGQPNDVSSWVTGNVPCSGSTKCVSGFFTSGLVPGGVGGGPILGAYTVRMTL